MKIGISIVLVVASSAVMSAQSTGKSSGGITLSAIVHEVKYCLGPTSYFSAERQSAAADDITLRLSVKLIYENHGTDPVILPLRFRSLARMVVAGRSGAEIVSSIEDPLDLNAVVKLARPEPPYFIVIPAGKPEFGYLGELLFVPVRSSEKQLLGTTVQFLITRDHGLLPPSMVEMLQAKWKSYGNIWAGTQDSEPLSLSIPQAPITVDCRKDERF
jgi:hypothetical protein